MKLDLSGVEFSKFDRKRGLKLPTIMNEQLAEDIGIMVGDGHIGRHIRKKTGVMDNQIMCFGNAVTDNAFYGEYVRALKKSIFNLDFMFYTQKDNTCILKLNSKGLLEFYTKTIGLPLGKKTNIRIPSIIMGSPDEIKCSFIRGLADSDFSMTFRKKHKNVLYYPLIKIGTASKWLIADTKEILDELGFKVTVSYDLKRIHPLTKRSHIGHELALNGKNNLEKWMTLIGTNNPKNILKYDLWKKQGFCLPDSEIRKIMKNMGSTSFELATFRFLLV